MAITKFATLQGRLASWWFALRSDKSGKSADPYVPSFDNFSRSLAGTHDRRALIKLSLAGMAGLGFMRLGVKTAWAQSNCLCNGRIYDSNTACCTAAGIVAKNPIANLADCPNKVEKQGYVCDNFNGCGGQGGARPPQSYLGANFVPACNTHDCCYDKCNSSKSTCDTNFLNDLSGICLVTFGQSPFTLQLLPSCLNVALVYYQFVNFAGQKYYDQAQRLSCDCCGTTTCRTCAGGSCGALPACAGGGDCVCFSTPQGGGACIHGSTPCAGLPTCSSNADCPPGYGCAATSCCGSAAVCGPLCSDVTPIPLPRRAARPGEKTIGGR